MSIKSAIKYLIDQGIGQKNQSRSIIQNYTADGLQSTGGVVTSIDSEKRTAMVEKTNGVTEEFFLQNRYVQVGSAVAAIGSRIL